MLQNHIFPGLAIFDKHHQTDLLAVLDVFFGWGGMWVELYQVANERDVQNLEYLANKVSHEEKIPIMDLCASHFCLWCVILLLVSRLIPQLRGVCEHDSARNKGSKK